MAKYLITGGAGFIGSHIAETLVGRGEEVVVYDNLSFGDVKNLKGIRDKIKLFEADIRDKEALHKAVAGADYILHQAALRSVPKSFENIGEYNDVNINGTVNVLVAARDAGVKKVVFASSSSVYGERDDLPEREGDKPSPLSPYAATKLAGELYCEIFSRIYGLKTVSLRYFNVFGPRQSLENKYAVVVPKFITNILKNESPPIYGDGMQSRDFTYIDNVVEANILSATTPSDGAIVLNVASGNAKTVVYLAEYINKMLKKDIKPVFGPPRNGDVKHTLADISEAEKRIGFTVKVDFEEGVNKAIEWFRANYPV